jgi:hypothetical protein
MGNENLNSYKLSGAFKLYSSRLMRKSWIPLIRDHIFLFAGLTQIVLIRNLLDLNF